MLQPFERGQLFTPEALDRAGLEALRRLRRRSTPVAVGSSYVGDRLVRVDNIATLDEVRGRGYGTAITAATIAVDLAKPATLIASDLGRPIYERLRFVAITRATYWLGMRWPRAPERLRRRTWRSCTIATASSAPSNVTTGRRPCARTGTARARPTSPIIVDRLAFLGHDLLAAGRACAA